MGVWAVTKTVTLIFGLVKELVVLALVLAQVLRPYSIVLSSQYSGLRWGVMPWVLRLLLSGRFPTGCSTLPILLPIDTASESLLCVRLGLVFSHRLRHCPNPKPSNVAHDRGKIDDRGKKVLTRKTLQVQVNRLRLPQKIKW